MFETFFFIWVYTICITKQTFEERFCFVIEDRADFDFYLRSKHFMTYSKFNKPPWFDLKGEPSTTSFPP